MDWDDLKPKPVKAITLGEDLKSLSRCRGSTSASWH